MNKITMASTYSPKDYESKIYNDWQTKKYFHANSKSQKEKFVVLIPPPNVTDRLHMGHGLNNTIQDILVRWKRMLGYEACWLPGTDHAGIATQMMVEKDLAKKNQNKKDLGRENFLKLLSEWKDEYGGIIIDQLKRLGCSADWDRMAYTMDPKLSKAVRQIFVDLYNDGLIYRGERLVNWDPELLTALSDDEVESEERSGTLWHIKYSLVNDENKFLVVATTRPETMLGDVAVAVHPDDDRYKDLIGQQVNLPLCGRAIPIIADEYVKMDFGSGVVKITPAHDVNDFEVGQRHTLQMMNIFDERACLNTNVPESYKGLDRYIARKKILQDLKAQNLIEKEESHKLAVPISSRSKAIIEPRLSKQWYLKMSELAKPAINAAKTNELNFYPESWRKTYLYWLENVRDWCISRQLWWGHRIPIWYCGDCEKVTCEIEDPTQCCHCKSKNISQDEDVLDTWFSSWLWPVSPFGWPENTEDLKAFFPSNVLVTGPDIIFLWVARMIMLGYKTQGKLAFKDVYFNSIICDKDGKKFSKTLGNGIDPLEMIDQYGADAVRYTCISLAPLGGRIKMSKEDFASGARFINKIWNASRFLLGQIKDDESIQSFEFKNLSPQYKWLIHSFNNAAAKVNDHLSKYQFSEALSVLYHFLWDDLCDWGIECAKSDLQNTEVRTEALSCLIYSLEGSLRLASPFMPFISEEIWRHLPSHPLWKRNESLMICDFPKANNSYLSEFDFNYWSDVQSVISAIRSVRSQMKVSPKDKIQSYISAESNEVFKAVKIWGPLLAGSEVLSSPLENSGCVVQVGKGFEARCYLNNIDWQTEKTRLNKESERLRKLVIGIENKLKNSAFKENAPEQYQQTLLQKNNLNTQLESINKTISLI